MLSGKTVWSANVIQQMLKNEKYIGNVRLLKSGNSEIHYLASDNNPTIISSETFESVQIEKVRRSNVTKDENGNRRKNQKYSSKSR